jgi:1-acyl-sn-glycerol-3-phosphate acyltransferase
MRNNLRALGRTLAGVLFMPVALSAVALQGFIVGPVLKNHNTIPNLLYNSLRGLLGIKVSFNKASANVDHTKPTWYVANHQSIADFLVLGSTLKGTFAGKGDVLQWPGISQMARAVKYIGIRRVKKEDPNFKKFNKMTIGKIMSNFNDGHNTIMFPEGTTTDGSYLAMFRAGLISLLFGEKGIDKKGNEIKLKQEVHVQPIAIQVKKVNGKDATNNPILKNAYSLYHESNTIKRLWNRLSTKSIEIELTAFEPLQPKHYKDQKELINAAHDKVKSVVAPDQQDIIKAAIPGVDDHKPQTYAPAPMKSP